MLASSSVDNTNQKNCALQLTRQANDASPSKLTFRSAYDAFRRKATRSQRNAALRTKALRRKKITLSTMSFMDSPTAFIRKEIVDALDEQQDSGDTVEVYPRAPSPQRPLLSAKSFEDPALAKPPAHIEQGFSNISDLTSAEFDDQELLILASKKPPAFTKTAPPPFLAKRAARRASAPAESLSDLAAAEKLIGAQKAIKRRSASPLLTFVAGVLLATSAFFWSPAVDLVLPRVHLDDANVNAPKPMCADDACSVWAHPLRIGAFSPLVIRPAPGADTSPQALLGFLDGHSGWTRDQLEGHGALLFRGFAVTNASAFEQISATIEVTPLATTYEGTSPRTSMSKYVKTAADLPPTSVVPAHAEMSFSPRPPARLYFYAHVANTGLGGETPITDLRAVAKALSPEARRRLARPLRFERVYYDEESWFGSLDKTKTKSFQGMFPGLTKPEIEIAAREKGYEPSFLRDGSLKLSHVVGSVYRNHPRDGEEAYHSHLTNLHVTTAWAAEHAAAARHLKAPTYILRSLFFSALYGSGLAQTLLKLVGSDIGAAVVEAETGAAVADVEYVRALLQKYTSTHQHQDGDVVVLDNFRVAHARNPWDGSRRELYAAWSA